MRFLFSSACLLVAVNAAIVCAQFPTTNPIQGSVPKSDLRFRLEKVFEVPESNGSAPRLELLTFAGDDGHLFVNDQRGQLFRFEENRPQPVRVADFSALIDDFRDGNQRGLRSFAVHPGYQDPNSAGFRKLYTAHSETNSGQPDHDSVVSEWTLREDGRVDTTIAGRELLRVQQPRGDHNIGRIGFNPNVSSSDSDWGNLYIALGDGGNFRTDRGDETLNPNAQDTQSRLGSILRIDPANPASDGTTPFSIPSDNPFVGDANYLPEIWAYGLRNPHTFGWDLGGTGAMYIGDIGQSDIEEINLGAAGANYGWSEREGTFSVAGKLPLSSGPIAVDALPDDHPLDGFTYPVAQYDHAPDDGVNVVGNAAISSGYVYRSSRLPALEGKFFFADFANNSGPIWMVDESELDQQSDFSDVNSQDGGYLAPFEELVLLNDAGQETTMLDILRDSTGNRSLRRTDIRFGQGGDGEVFVMNKHDGWVRRFAPAVPGDCDGDGVLSTADLSCSCADLDAALDGLGLLRGDLDGDGEVGFADFLSLSSNFGLQDLPAGYASGDIDCDGEVGFADFLTMSTNFGQTDEIANVPEPKSFRMAWVLFGVLFCFRHIRRPWAVTSLAA